MGSNQKATSLRQFIICFFSMTLVTLFGYSWLYFVDSIENNSECIQNNNAKIDSCNENTPAKFVLLEFFERKG